MWRACLRGNYPHDWQAVFVREREARAARLAVYRTIDGSIDHDDASAWSAGDIVRYAALRRGITGEEDWIGWIDETLARLQRLGARST